MNYLFENYYKIIFKFTIKRIKHKIDQIFDIVKIVNFEKIIDLNESISKLKIFDDDFMCIVDFICQYVVHKNSIIKSHCVLIHKGVKSRFTINDDESSFIFISRCQQMFAFERVSNYFRVNFMFIILKNFYNTSIFLNANTKAK